MVSSITSALFGLASILTIVTLWVWKGSRDIRTNYTDDFDEMMTYYASQFRSELNEIVVQILAEVREEDQPIGEDAPEVRTDGAEPVPLEMQTMDVIERQIEREELKDIEDALREFDKPINLYEDVKDYYGSTWMQFGAAAIGTVIIALLTAFFPQNSSAEGFELFLGVIVSFWIFGGIRKFKWAWEAERKLDDLIDDYSTTY